MMQSLRFLLPLLLGVALVSGCKEERVVLPGAVEHVESVSDAALEQYIFRVYIDILGDAPTERQIASWSQSLRSGGLDSTARLDLVLHVQNEENRPVYAENIYQLVKTRMLESFPDTEIDRKFIGMGTVEDDVRLNSLLSWRTAFVAGDVSVLDLQKFALYNLVFDRIEMGSFNFVRASFDKLFWRYPTNAEYSAAFDMVEFNLERELFGQTASNKTEFVDLMIANPESVQGLILWQYDQLLARRPTAHEIVEARGPISASGNVFELQQHILISEEYAGF